MAIILLQILLLLSLSETALSAEDVYNNISLPGCNASCGGIPIPYPFGIGTSCSLSTDFNVTCALTGNGDGPFLDKARNGKPTPYLNSYEILNISIPLGQARLNNLVASRCYDTTKKGCLSTCDDSASLTKYGPSCSGIACCQTAIPKETNTFQVDFDGRYNPSVVQNFSPCSHAMVVEDAGFKFNASLITTVPVTTDFIFDEIMLPAVFDWAIGNTTCNIAKTNKSSYACQSDHSVCLNSITGKGYICNCSDGYQGNPYLPGGCHDIDECATQNPCSKHGKCHNLPGKYRCSCSFGWRTTHNNTQNPCELNLALIIGCCASVVALSFLGFAAFVFLERRNISKIRMKHFQQYGGWVLLESIKSNQGLGFVVFTKQQLEQATNNFDSANIIGHGGNGIVYKGIIRDQIVAIKKCKIIDESKKKEFGKEMLILSHISHKNIVKLLGCCLEVEVPMLVYEFIPNGTLHQYIHHKNYGSCIPLTTRLRIAYESAEALAYLHTTASPPIFHGDVKSANILLDKKYTAKVADFGASLLATADDEAQIVTFVQGTLGYLDPEYMQTHRLTNKSDVYSFGVVLVELLTSKPIIDFDEAEEEKGLAIRFLSAMKENKMQELLDDEINHHDDMELICEVATLAKECLSMRGEDRPTMMEVAAELQRISKLKQHPWEQEYNPEETMFLLGEGSHHDIVIELTSCSCNVDEEAVESIATGR